MRKQLTQDKRIVIIGSKSQITEAEITLLKNIPDLPTLPELVARLKIQELLDSENLKIDIMLNGNSIWSKKRILKDIKIVKKYGMSKLSNYLYKFLSLSCGSIAHYNRYGWINSYPTISDLKNFFRHNEFGQRVINYLPMWNSDARIIVQEIEQELGI